MVANTPIVEQQDVRVFENIEPTQNRAVGVVNAQIFTYPGRSL